MYGTKITKEFGYTKLTTNGNGQIEAKNLLREYQFVEEKAPEHYEIDKTA